MRPRTTLALALLALALAAFVVLWEHDKPGTRGEAELARRLLPSKVDIDRVTRIELDRAAGSLILQREGETWSLVEPLKDLASTERVERILATLDAVEVLARLPVSELETPLGEPATRVTLADAEDSVRLEIFDPRVAGTQVYAKLDRGAELLLLPLSLVEELALSADDLRRARALPYSASEVARFDVAGKNAQPLAFERGTRGWRVVHPYSDQADASRVGALLDAFLALRTDRFRPASPPSSEPWLTLTARDREGNALPRLEIGEPSEDAGARRWARVEGRPGALRLDARGLARQIAASPEHWRSLLVLDFAPSELRELRFESGVDTLVLERQDPDAPWVQRDGALPVDQTRIAELVFQLARVEASGVCTSCAPPGASAGARLVLRSFVEDAPELASLEIFENPADEATRLVRRDSEGPFLLVPAERVAIPRASSLTVSKLHE